MTSIDDGLKEEVPVDICPIDGETECRHSNIKECRGCDAICSDDEWKDEY